jgi:hypothetical protein
MSKDNKAPKKDALDFTPAAPRPWLYDFLVAVLTREKKWCGLLLVSGMMGRAGFRDNQGNY